MRVAIHQPEYWPCLPLLAKIKRADMLVILDHVQFKRDSLQQRCKIAGPVPGGVRWLSIPYVHRHPQRICDVEFADTKWAQRHADIIRQMHRKAPAFKKAWTTIEETYLGDLGCCHDRFLATASARTANLLTGVFDLGLRLTIRSSEWSPTASEKGQLILDICRDMGATEYVTGRGGAAYLDAAAFEAAGIKITLSEYEVPTYRENQPKDPGLSALDAWMWLGDKAKELLP